MTLQRYLVAAVLAAASVLSGCASTRIDLTGSPLKAPLCQPGGEPLTTVIYWGTQWRPDQKEPALREAAALRGINEFLSHTHCLSVAAVHRLPAGSSIPSDEELLRSAASPKAVPERVVHIVVRELGPHLSWGIPVIVEGGTEVVIEVEVRNPQTSAVLANTRIHWRNGGRFVIKGVRALDQDMRAALDAALMPGTPGK